MWSFRATGCFTCAIGCAADAEGSNPYCDAVQRRRIGTVLELTFPDGAAGGGALAGSFGQSG